MEDDNTKKRKPRWTTRRCKTETKHQNYNNIGFIEEPEASTNDLVHAIINPITFDFIYSLVAKKLIPLSEFLYVFLLGGV